MPRLTAPRTLGAFEVLWLVLLVLYPVLFESYGPSFGQRLVIFSMLALSLDVAWGVTGVYSLGHGAFFGVGAYSVAVIASKHSVTNGFVLVAAAVGIASLVALLIALFLFSGRREVGIWYTALATLALSFGAQRLAEGSSYLGSNSGLYGFRDVWLPGITTGSSTMAYVALLVLLATIYIILRVVMRSWVGLRLNAIRDDAERMSQLGYRVAMYRTVAYTGSAAIAGLAGALWAITSTFVAPQQLGVTLSTQIVLWMLIGGAGTLIGPVVGVGIYQFMEFELSDRFPTGWSIGFGAVVVLTVLGLPEGIVGTIVHRIGRRARRITPERFASSSLDEAEPRPQGWR
jgi:branched-chain amino acid transport system permease protein